jgi:hypothetical protein
VTYPNPTIGSSDIVPADRLKRTYFLDSPREWGWFTQGDASFPEDIGVVGLNGIHNVAENRAPKNNLSRTLIW